MSDFKPTSIVVSTVFTKQLLELRNLAADLKAQLEEARSVLENKKREHLEVSKPIGSDS